MKKESICIAVILLLIFTTTTKSFAQTENEYLAKEIQNSKQLNPNKVLLSVYTDSRWSGEIQDGDYISHKIGNIGSDRFQISCGESNTISIHIYPILEGQSLSAFVIKNGKILANQKLSTPGQAFDVTIDCLYEGKFQESNFDIQSYIIVGIILAAVIAGSAIFVTKKHLLKNKFG